ncbi:hypothetical protein GOP47_0009527 [Adiantum capillus-veneris]|uniref:Cytochrome P450 n=1 Tax=Adiantum capillus-veneris TaxID=13818 RepID=A0A9D4UWU1_ADICA|nr:hypothetical protein GOP47_0009527 [Adiantum capillus-veneris]
MVLRRYTHLFFEGRRREEVERHKNWAIEKEERIARPKNWPVIGCQVEASLNFHRLHDWCHMFFSDQNRTVELKFFTTRIYLTVDPTNVEYILKTNFCNYPKGERTREKLRDLLGDGIFNADGEIWKKQRRIANAIFSGNKNLKDLSVDSFRKDSLCLLATLLTYANTGQPINIQDLLMGMTMDSISRVGFGIQGGGMFTMRNTFTRAFDRANAMISRRYVNVWWKVHKGLRLGTEKSLVQELDNLNAFTSQVIAERRDQFNKQSPTPTCCESPQYKVRGDILSKLMDIGGGKSTEKDLRDSIMNFTIAGRDTTAVTMAWFIYNICIHKEVAKSIYEEVNKVIHASLQQSIVMSSSCDQQPLNKYEQVAYRLTYHSLSRMHYLHAALTETLRLYPAVPRDTKVALDDDMLPDGTHIRKGDHVAYVPYSMGRMEFIWGKDALEFKPQRWLKDGHFSQPSPFKFSSFQAGPRMCIGKDWAYLQMKMTMALLLYFFEFKLVPGQAVQYQMMLVLSIANGLHVTVHDRANI